MIDDVIIRHKLSSQGKITAYVLGIVNDSLYGIAPTISTLGSVALLSPLISDAGSMVFGLGAFFCASAYSIFKNKEVEINNLKKIAKAGRLFERILETKKSLALTCINRLDKSRITDAQQSLNKLLDGLDTKQKNEVLTKQIFNMFSETEFKEFAGQLNKLQDIIPAPSTINSYWLAVPAMGFIGISSLLGFSDVLANNQMIGGLSILGSNIIQGLGLHIAVASKLRKNDNDIELSLAKLEKELKNIAAINIELKHGIISKLTARINNYPSWLQNLEKELASHNKSKVAFRDAIIKRNKNQQELSSLTNKIGRQQSELDNIPVIKKKLQEFFQEILKAKTKYSLAAIKAKVAQLLSTEPYKKSDIKVAVDSKDEKLEIKETELFDSYLKDFKILSEDALEKEKAAHIHTKVQRKNTDEKIKIVEKEVEKKQTRYYEITAQLRAAKKPIEAIRKNIAACTNKDVLIPYISKMLPESSSEVYSPKHATSKVQKCPRP